MTAAVLSRSEDVAWFRVDHESAVGAVRRATIALAERLGLSQARAGEAGIVASELAGNQVRHAGGGRMALRACRTAAGNGVELLASDSGPGMPDVQASFRDGHSTGGTLGIGLGAVARLSTALQVHSAPGRGTVICAGIGPSGTTRLGDLAAVAALSRPIDGEDVCGDAYAVRLDGDVLSAALLDGLGHGPLAHAAASAGVRAFLAAPAGDVTSLLTALHRGLAGTRGAAVAVLQYGGGDRVRHGGIGNIGGHLLGGERRRGLVTYPGIAGGRARTVREAGYDLPPGGTVVLHTDGLREHLQLPPQLERGADPLIVAAVCLRDLGVRRDDAGVLVLTRGPR